jgi:aryl-alcohol dehydrogenase-like predicted oxidoreductase
MLPKANIPAINREIPIIGLGCGRLVGGLNLKQSARIVETALELGIRYFDVAPSYGMGTAESVLGAVVGDARDVVVATKYGVPRGSYSVRSAFARRFVKPAVDAFGPVKDALRRRSPVEVGGSRPRERYDFSEAALRASLTKSLELLRRSSIDVFLAHEPHPDDLTDDLRRLFHLLHEQGWIGTFGVGINAQSPPWSSWGHVWQSGWDSSRSLPPRPDVTYSFHGVLRWAARTQSGRLVDRAPKLLASVVSSNPGSIFLVSASTPGRLRELLSEFG